MKTLLTLALITLTFLTSCKKEQLEDQYCYNFTQTNTTYVNGSPQTNDIKKDYYTMCNMTDRDAEQYINDNSFSKNRSPIGGGLSVTEIQTLTYVKIK